MNRKAYSVFDLRDGANHSASQGNSRKLVNVPWHWPERSISVFETDGHKKAMRRLIAWCKKDGEQIHAAFFHNYAVSVILKGN